MKERKLTDYEKSKAEKEFCFYHCKGFRDKQKDVSVILNAKMLRNLSNFLIT